jgi:hypothetical protein
MRKSSEIHADIVQSWGARKSADLRTLRFMQEMDESLGYFDFGVKNLFEYGVKIHGMSESEALSFLRVSRTSQKMPELMEGILQGDLTLTNGVVLSSLINDPKIPVEEKKAWIETAKDCSKGELQNKIADSRPDTAVKDRERKKKVSKTLTKIEFLVNEEQLAGLLHLQSILGKTKLTDTILWAVEDVTQRKDPVKHAERAEARKEKKQKTLSHSHAPNPTPTSASTASPSDKIQTSDTFKIITQAAKTSDQSISKTRSGSSRLKTPTKEDAITSTIRPVNAATALSSCNITIKFPSRKAAPTPQTTFEPFATTIIS